jgi:hypothetical protein
MTSSSDGAWALVYTVLITLFVLLWAGVRI